LYAANTGCQVTGILQGTVLLLDIVFIQESYVPVLLARKAAQLRISTGNRALHAKWEEDPARPRDLAVKYGLRPLQMLVTPICLSITIYVSFIYATFYASLASFPIIFQETRGWTEFIGSLPFLAVLIGIAVGAGVNVANQKYYNARFIANNSVPVPEARLPPMMIASVVLAGGLFIMGWTSTTSIHWFGTIVGVFMLGFGYYTIFTSGINYLIDTFQRWGASALAANTFVRSVLAAVLPLLIPAMYHRLGNGWAFTILGVFAILNIPIPFVFWFYGPKIRRMGKYTSNLG
jgi:MFS family permease